MDGKAILIKYAEIAIKGKNRHLFEDALIRNIKTALREIAGAFRVEKESGRIYVRAEEACDFEGALAALTKVFGIVYICPVVICAPMDIEALKERLVQYVREEYPDCDRSFKVYVKRADKHYPMDSMQIAAELGAAVLADNPAMRVDVHAPEILLSVEIRRQFYLYSKTIAGPGGMPTGTGGRATLLLSGGIDSPVAGYMIAKRGVEIEAVYFHAPPYTSERAKQKVVDLAKQLARYAGPIRLHIVNFTEIQMAIYEKCPHDELTIIMRRFMMRIAERFAKESGAEALITGESIGQVASQTIPSLVCTDAVCTMPVFRPLIGFDKQEIIKIAEAIDTYETSILPYEDCCTIFVAKHPVTKPQKKRIERSEQALSEGIDALFARAVDEAETLVVTA